MSRTAIDAQAEVRQLTALTWPFMWLEGWDVTSWFGQYELKGIVKLPGSLAADITAREVRSLMLERAEEMLDALAAAGWQPAQNAIDMNFSTRVHNFTQTLDGVMVEPSRQSGVSLDVSLRVVRAR